MRANREHFPLPNPKIHKQKNPLPDLLDYFREEITLPWLEYCIENLANLTVELAHNELITKIIRLFPMYMRRSRVTSMELMKGAALLILMKRMRTRTRMTVTGSGITLDFCKYGSTGL